MVRNVLLFLIVCGISGPAILGGSILGNAFGKTGLFAGAMLGGVAGIALSLDIARRLGWLETASYVRVLLMTLVGFAIAATIAVLNLSGPTIPAACVLLIGASAVAAKLWSLRNR